jgi:hypothetical protein
MQLTCALAHLIIINSTATLSRQKVAGRYVPSAGQHTSHPCLPCLATVWSRPSLRHCAVTRSNNTTPTQRTNGCSGLQGQSLREAILMVRNPLMELPRIQRLEWAYRVRTTLGKRHDWTATMPTFGSRSRAEDWMDEEVYVASARIPTERPPSSILVDISS